jgi:hypothetical protein
MHRVVQLMGSFGCGVGAGALTLTSSEARSIIEWWCDIVKTSGNAIAVIKSKRAGQLRSVQVFRNRKRLNIPPWHNYELSHHKTPSSHCYPGLFESSPSRYCQVSVTNIARNDIILILEYRPQERKQFKCSWEIACDHDHTKTLA